MPRDMFGDVVDPSIQVGTKQWYTVPLSILAHFVVLFLLVVIPLLATDSLPDVPSMSEAIPAFNKPSTWFGVLGPAGLSGDITTRLNAEMAKALSASDVQSKLDSVGLSVIGGTPAEFGALIKDGIERYGAIIRDAGLQPG